MTFSITPDGLPVLSAGAHSGPQEGACVMELVSYIAGEAWSDSPACTHPVLAATARRVNDSLPDSERHRLVPLIGRLFGTAPTGTDHEQQVLSVQLAVWSGRQVLHLTREEDRAACATALDVAEAWTRGEATKEECAYAAYAANAASNAAYDTASAASNAAYAAYAATAASNAAYAASNAAYAANAGRVAMLTGLIDEYDRLTGRTEHRPVTASDYAALTGAL